MKLTTKQVKNLNANLEFGEKEKLAAHLKVAPQSLSRWLREKKMPSKLFIECWAFIKKRQALVNEETD